MQIVTGTVVEGKIVVEGVSFPEGTAVVVLAKADSENGFPCEAFLESLKKYG
jgi:hypothetical protein